MTGPSEPRHQTAALFEDLVRIPLQIASELAARRDSKLNLHADLPCMLALMFTIDNLAGLAHEAHEGKEDRKADNPETPSPDERLEDAANAACLMVLQRAGLEDQALAECLQALHAALDNMVRHGVLGPQAAHCHTAWPALQASNLPGASRALQSAIHECVHAIDCWEADERHTLQ